MKISKGFTLIELMIVVAIISLLALIAMTAFPPYIARTQLAAALADVTPGKTIIETTIYEGSSPANVTAESVGGSQNAHCSSVTVELSSAGEGFIRCTLKGIAAVEGRNLYLRRSSAGGWSCDASEFDVNFRPSGC
ncbi:prepilin-type cleavage/methylation domain-containing protein [Stenotrophomonas sp. SPM]|uniref:pilin n=1 Tax=unclassified Stenotrophomonas TaxID=196198 RepID=UPI000DE69FCE|nr:MULTISPECIES: pilin [unclassified Stenotrophomonas]PWB27049.1 prepilin-type cleavage/methylation domain-containing protein [Stenotrophomonas sp. SPM]